jgi:hypothetical protein
MPRFSSWIHGNALVASPHPNIISLNHYAWGSVAKLKVHMFRKLLLVGAATLVFTACTTPLAPNTDMTLHVNTYDTSWKVTGLGYTPQGNVEISALGAPIPCGNTFCPNSNWEAIGTLIGRPNVAGVPYPGAIDSWITNSGASTLRAQHGTASPTCKPRSLWNLSFMAKDLTTGRFAMRPPEAGDFPIDVAPLFSGLPDCRE